MIDTQYRGATQETSVMSRLDCLTACDHNNACVAYGWYTSPNPDECWIHTRVWFHSAYQQSMTLCFCYFVMRWPEICCWFDLQASDLQDQRFTLTHYDSYLKGTCVTPSPTAGNDVCFALWKSLTTSSCRGFVVVSFAQQQAFFSHFISRHFV